MNLEESLLNKASELSFDLLEMPGCIKLNTCNYKPLDRVELSASINAIHSVFGIDIQSAMLSHISGEFSSSLTNKVLRNISNTQLIDFIDKRGVGDITLAPFSITKDIVSDIINYASGYSNIVCSGSVACILQDDARFYIAAYMSQIKSGYMYHVGDISGIKVWVDPFMKYDDYKLLAFNNVGVDVNNFYSKIVAEATFAPKIVVGFDVDVIYDNVKKIYIITDNGGEGWSLFMQHNRNSKINDVLDEEE